MRSLFAATIVLTSLILAGCTDKPSAPATATGTLDSNLDEGSIGGVVFDDERLPIADARLTLTERDESTTSDGGGRFVFLHVPPGTYTLRAVAGGHERGEQRVTLQPGEGLVVRIELRLIPSPKAYFETDIGALYHTCMLYTLLYVSHCTAPYTTAYEAASRQGVSLGAYGVPPDLAENVYRHNFTVGPDHTGIVSELEWRANSEATEYMWLTLNCGWYDPVSDGCAPPGQGAAPTFAGRRGPSPLRAQWVHPEPSWLPWVIAKARVTGDLDQYAGASVDQRLTVYNTVFYFGPAPEDWSVLATAS
jgi:hypothetical protein